MASQERLSLQTDKHRCCATKFSLTAQAAVTAECETIAIAAWPWPLQLPPKFAKLFTESWRVNKPSHAAFTPSLTSRDCT